MNFVLERVSDPESEPLTVAELKRHLRAYESDTSEDTDLVMLIKAAREWVEDFTGRALIDQTWRLTVGQAGMVPIDTVQEGVCRPDYYCGRYQWSRVGHLLLRRSPVLAITSVKSVAEDGTETTIDSGDYALRDADSKWPYVVALEGANWSQGVFRVTFRAGYADNVASPGQGAEVVPARFKQAMKLWAEGQYDNEQLEKLTKAAEDLIKPERCNLQFA